jgi:ribosomal protein S12 methylthiotransferase accessory factor
VEVVAPHTVFLLSEHRHFVFEGAIYVTLLPLLNGQHTFGEILSTVSQQFSLGEFYGALQRLARRNCIVETNGERLPEHTAFWDHLDVETAATQVTNRLHGTRLTLRTIGDLPTDELTLALTQSGLQVDAAGELLVVSTDDYLRDELAEINQQALMNARPWVLLKLVGVVVWIGPLFWPGKTGCWQCLEQRLRANRQVERYIQNRAESPVRFATSKVRLASALRVGASFAATEIAKAIALDGSQGLQNTILTFDLLSYALDTHTLVQRPQCSACGQRLQIAAPGPITLTSQKKRHPALAGQRTATPEETFQRFQHHVSPITGIVTSLVARDLHGSGVAYNYVAGHYFPFFSDDMTTLQVNQMARSGGKGATESQAKASALAEALERYSGICWGDEYTVRASYASIRPEAIHIRDVLGFSEAQYKNHRQWNAQLTNERHYVPDPLDDQAEISWTPLWSLSHDRVRYLPTAFCFYGHVDPGHGFCRCDSNGCASGNTMEEAILQGFLELAERDAVALWWYNCLRRPAVDVDSFGLPYWRKMQAYYRQELHRDLQVLDITNDLEIPTFVVVSRRLDQETEDILIGFGTHLDPRTAMMQALAEANQSVPILHYVTADGSTLARFHPQDVRDWLQHATYANQPYLVPDPAAPPKTLADYQQRASADVREDVLTCVRTAKSRGLEVLVLDQTRPDIGMPVVRVVVPGLRHFWRRLGPGRLYDVPVQLGWLDKPLDETALNPISCFI